MTPGGTVQAGDPQLDLLLRQLHQAFEVRSWHGPNLMGSLRGLKGEVVGWRPQPARHNIAELVVHAAYWKYRVSRLISEEPPRSFDLAGSDFLERNGEPAEWKADLQLLRDWHGRLAAAVEAFPPENLPCPVGSGEFTFVQLIGGAAAHDLYHAGQIQLLKRMYADRQPRPGGR